jgi:hypothetical protein
MSLIVEHWIDIFSLITKYLRVNKEEDRIKIKRVNSMT